MLISVHLCIDKLPMPASLFFVPHIVRARRTHDDESCHSAVMLTLEWLTHIVRQSYVDGDPFCCIFWYGASSAHKLFGERE